MDKLKTIIDYGYGIEVDKFKSGYFARIIKQLDVDRFDEYETPLFATIEEAVDVAYNYAILQ